VLYAGWNLQRTAAVECAALGGNFQGMGTSCDPNPCPIPLLVADAGSNKAVTQGDSTLLEGSVSGGVLPYAILWSPAGSLNDPEVLQPLATPTETTVYTLTVTDARNEQVSDTVRVTVVMPKGACCMADGSCSAQTADDCAAVGGTYQGDGISCNPNPCPQPSCACCFEVGTCQELTESECVDAGGAYQGYGTTCDPNLCPQPTGACCFEDGSCQELTESDCMDSGGAYQGNGISCNPNLCPQPTGACCFDEEVCEELTEIECLHAGGMYKGDGTSCTPNPCIVIDVIYVRASATGSHTGLSWADAYTDLQDAMDAAVHGNQIWVAAGTYKPTTGTNRSVSFVMKEGVAIYGGFAGNEARGAFLLTDRDIAGHRTILSGDIGTPDDVADNSYHVVIGADNAVLDGFTITGGNANSSSQNAYGGGMQNYGSSPRVANCTFTGNSADYGGGMSNSYDSDPIVLNCTFMNNKAFSSGGGMYSILSSPIVLNCTFSNNTAAYGGGIYNGEGRPSIRNSTVTNNNASYGGGMLSSYYSEPTVHNSIVWANAEGQIAKVSNTTFVMYSCVQGGHVGEGNISKDPVLLPLADNGGGTWTHAIALHSPALAIPQFAGGGNWNNSPDTDQRGMLRATQGHRAMGAFEGDVPSAGACCFGNGTCEVLEEALCIQNDGIYQGSGTGCTPNPCPLPACAPPAIVPSGGTYDEPILVTLSTTTQGASIRYTTNGNEPTSGSAMYNGPFVLTHSATVKACAFRDGYQESQVSSADFIVGSGSERITPPRFGCGGIWPLFGGPTMFLLLGFMKFKVRRTIQHH
jgi:hypothetical protein